jgi:oxygen-dependent protoporphyrinogen oxidase
MYKIDQPEEQHYDVAIVGAGASGLACAYQLAKSGVRVVLIEAKDRVGGVIESFRAGDDGEYLLEKGPNSLSNKPDAGWRLCDELGLEDQAQRRTMRDHDRYLWDGQQLQKVPTGLPGMVRTHLLSLGTKARMALEPILGGPVARDVASSSDDLTLHEYFAGHFGKELVETFLTPFVSGVYAADPKQISFRSTFPRLHNRVQGRRSIVVGGFLGPKNKSPEKATSQPERTKQRVPRFLFSFDEGLSTLTNKIAERFTELGGTVLLGQPVESIVSREGAENYQIRFTNSTAVQSINCTELVVATPAQAASKLLQEVSSESSEYLAKIKYNALTVIHLAVKRDSLESHPEGFGYLVPRNRGVRMLGAIWNSNLFEARAPDGTVLMTCFYGGQLDPDAVNLSDDELLAELRRDLGKTQGWNGAEPELYQVTRWNPCLPVFERGYPHLMQQLRESLPTRVHLLGNYLESISLPDCLHHGELLANKLIDKFAASDVATKADSPTPAQPVGTA